MNRIARHLKELRGITLIELLFVLAILGIVTIVSMSFFTFGVKAFSGGNAQYNSQSNVRHAVDLIDNEIKFATEVEILASAPDPATLLQTDVNNYIILSNNGVYHSEYISDDEPRKLRFIDGYLSNTSSIQSDSGRALIFDVKGIDGTHEYEINKRIELPNLKLLNRYIEGEISGIAVQYSKVYDASNPPNNGGGGGEEQPSIFYNVTFEVNFNNAKVTFNSQVQTASGNQKFIIFNNVLPGTYNYEVRKSNNTLVGTGTITVVNDHIEVDVFD